MVRFTDLEFEQLKELMRHQFGIDLSKKRVLAECRLSTEVEKRKLPSFGAFLKLMEEDKSGRLLTVLLDRITTNYTYFFREPKHFEYLTNKILPNIKPGWDRISYRVWCAGCSSGQECYTFAMVLQDYKKNGGFLPLFDILGTDISENALSTAKEGRYPIRELTNIPVRMQNANYIEQEGEFFTFSQELKRKVVFRRMNLLHPSVGVGQYDLVVCRNVMIYFDEDSRKRLLDQLYRALKPGGYLFVGHTELLPRKQELFTYVCPAIYRK